VAFLHERHSLSIRRSCCCVGLSRSAWYRHSQEPSQAERDEPVIDALNEAVDDAPRRGFWKLYRRLRRQGHPWNHKRVYRVYRAMGLNQPRRTKRRLPPRAYNPLFVPDAPNTVWSADFMSDGLYTGKRFRTFNIVDDFNREVVAIEIDTSINGHRLARIFERVKAERGLPEILRVDNGPEFLSDAFRDWAEANGVFIQYIQPGKPNQNAFIERFNRTFRHEVLDLYLFNDLDEVREITHWWVLDYNEERAHDALGDLPPVDYAQLHSAAEDSKNEWSS